MSSISTTRRVLAVMVVTTALCADQAVVAAAAPRPQTVEIAQLASRLVTRLAQNFKRTLPGVIREPARPQREGEATSPADIADRAVVVAHASLSPFQFRLPPPAV